MHNTSVAQNQPYLEYANLSGREKLTTNYCVMEITHGSKWKEEKRLLLEWPSASLNQRRPQLKPRRGYLLTLSYDAGEICCDGRMQQRKETAEKSEPQNFRNRMSEFTKSQFKTSRRNRKRLPVSKPSRNTCTRTHLESTHPKTPAKTHRSQSYTHKHVHAKPVRISFRKKDDSLFLLKKKIRKTKVSWDTRSTYRKTEWVQILYIQNAKHPQSSMDATYPNEVQTTEPPTVPC